ncbi:MAG: hypothetical protein R3F50_19020 [Gammaproteobacteria bacterium]
MKLLGWFPFRYIIRKAATSQGFLDPIELLARLRALAQPSEVGEPVELLRAGVVFHARGLINSKVIQHNLDWLWPYWVERQYNPHDISFTPRAFAITHINQTHRNWSAIGLPDLDQYPIVDPRGLLTPKLDGWSLDVWILRSDGSRLLPSRQKDAEQFYNMDPGLAVVTVTGEKGMQLRTVSEVVRRNGYACCEMNINASDSEGGDAWLVVSARPYNPEGISFISRLELLDSASTWRINDDDQIRFDCPVEKHRVASYLDGDVYLGIHDRAEKKEVNCQAGLASAAAMFRLDRERQLKLSIPLEEEYTEPVVKPCWLDERQTACRLVCPESRYQNLYDAALASLILHSPRDVYPGPYTYKRFWFRDAAFIVHALLCSGLEDRARRSIDEFFHRQTPLGYFRSQEGEWDSNGEVLWILNRYKELTGLDIPNSWLRPIEKGGRWIIRKLTNDDEEILHAGLLPAGFSAEHLGPNDYYYWDDFWAASGLRSCSALLEEHNEKLGREFSNAADRLMVSIDRSLSRCYERLGRPAIPASPYRRLDAGAIGSIVAGYPLQLVSSQDERLLDCVEYLLDDCFVDGAFFQDMIHSGMNAYLTLQTAQVLLRANDPRFLELMDSVADLASPTGQWPEAIHPQTRGGCMGDGQHVWATAEWVLMIRSCFVLEEGNRLILGAGIPKRWLHCNKRFSFGPTFTRFGALTVTVDPRQHGRLLVEWEPRWHRQQPEIDIAIPGYQVRERSDRHALLEPLASGTGITS